MENIDMFFAYCFAGHWSDHTGNLKDRIIASPKRIGWRQRRSVLIICVNPHILDQLAVDPLY